MIKDIILKTPNASGVRYRLTPLTNEELRNDPEFIRLPSPRGRCKYCGLSRSTLIEYLPYIKHVSPAQRRRNACDNSYSPAKPAGILRDPHVHTEAGTE
jgi:hypothetical protein